MQLKFLKLKKNFKKKSFEIHSNFYWQLAVTLVFVLTAISFAFGYYMFSQTREEPDTSVDSTNTKQLVEKEKLKNILLDFSIKEKKSADIINNPTIVVDPSL